ncbi:hypothetical protein LDENG_00129690 [Lucifuga dentata]|nr:hypothetical protein LDENG_00129690 [Lucifuga dentata]
MVPDSCVYLDAAWGDSEWQQGNQEYLGEGRRGKNGTKPPEIPTKPGLRHRELTGGHISSVPPLLAAVFSQKSPGYPQVTVPSSPCCVRAGLS